MKKRGSSSTDFGEMGQIIQKVTPAAVRAAHGSSPYRRLRNETVFYNRNTESLRVAGVWRSLGTFHGVPWYIPRDGQRQARRLLPQSHARFISTLSSPHGDISRLLVWLVFMKPYICVPPATTFRRIPISSYLTPMTPNQHNTHIIITWHSSHRTYKKMYYFSTPNTTLHVRSSVTTSTLPDLPLHHL